MHVCGNDIFVFSSFSNQPSGPFKFRGDNQFVGISGSHESLIRFVEAINENESQLSKELANVYSKVSVNKMKSAMDINNLFYKIKLDY